MYPGLVEVSQIIDIANGLEDYEHLSLDLFSLLMTEWKVSGRFVNLVL